MQFAANGPIMFPKFSKLFPNDFKSYQKLPKCFQMFPTALLARTYQETVICDIPVISRVHQNINI